MFQNGLLTVNVLQERAAKNKTFLYVKIPEVPLRVSYKVSQRVQEQFIPLFVFDANGSCGGFGFYAALQQTATFRFPKDSTRSEYRIVHGNLLF
jgi:hypothetical protein